MKRRVQLEIVPMIATERAVSDALAGVHSGGANMSEVLKQVAEDVAAAGDVEVQSNKNGRDRSRSARGRHAKTRRSSRSST